MPWMATDLYGGSPSVQPTATPNPDHGPGTPTPMARSVPTGGALGNPLLLLMVMVGLAFGLVHFSVSVGAGK